MSGRTTARWAAVAALALVSSAFTLPAPAQAAPTWLPEQTVSGAPFSLTVNARIAVDPLGNTTAVWYHTAGGTGLVRAAYRPAGGTWGAPLTISDPDRFAQTPDIVVDRSGTVTAAWMAEAPGGGRQIESARLPLGGSWSSPMLVGEAELIGPRLAVDNAGIVTVVWLEYRTPQYVVRVSSLVPGGGWTVGKDLSNPAVGSINPQIAVDPATGAAAAVWQTFDGNSLVYAARRPPGGAWSTAQLVSELGEDANPNPQVSIDNQGTATVLFGKYLTTHYEAYWSSAPAIGTWSMPQRLSTPGATVAELAVTSASSGETTAVWSELASTSVVRASTRSASGTWSAAVPLSDDTGSAGSPSVRSGSDGSTYVLWQWYSGSSRPLQLAKHPPGGAWSAPVDVAAQPATGPDTVHAIGVDDDGDVAVAYLNGSPTPATVAVRSLDAAGPLVTMTAPGTATAGAGQAYTATASDHWSAIASYQWTFGDGTSAPGASVTHTYAATGSYPVTLTVTDAVGNATTRTATTVVAAPVPGITVFKLKKKRIATDERTKLKVGLTTAATVRIVLVSKHRHRVNGKRKHLRVVLRKSLPAGLSKVTINGKKLEPDTWKVIGTAKNAAGTSSKRKAKLVVVKQ